MPSHKLPNVFLPIVLKSGMFQHNFVKVLIVRIRVEGAALIHADRRT